MREYLFTLKIDGTYADWYVYASHTLHGWQVDKFVEVRDSGDFFAIDSSHPKWVSALVALRRSRAFELIEEDMA